MAIKIETVPYELLLRFSSGEVHQTAPAGAMEAAHLIEGTLISDDETGEMHSYKVGTAKPITAEIALKFFGTNAGSFLDGFNAAKAEKDRLTQQVEQVSAELSQLKKQEI